MPQWEGNDSTRTYQDNSSDFLMKVIGDLNTSLSSIESQLKDLTKAVSTFQGNYDKNTKSSFSKTSGSSYNFQRSSNDWKRSFETTYFKDLDKITQKKLKEIDKQVETEHGNLDKELETFRANSKLELEYRMKQIQLAYERDKREARNNQEEIEAEKKLRQQRIELRNDYRNMIQEWKLSTSSKKEEVSNKAYVERERVRRIGDIRQRNADTLSRATSQNGNSAYLSMRTLLSSENKTEKQQLEEVRDEQIEFFKQAREALAKFLKDNKDIDDDERELFEKQLKQYDKQIKIRQDWTYTGELLTRAGKDLVTAGKNIVTNLGRNVLKTVEDKYLTSYKEGFQNVYQSVENTRNTVSARLKLDQGGFTQLQEELQTEIQAQGLESTVSMVDVNNAIAELSAAGVTDTDMLKTLALEQAKLTASGSSLNLGNEEMLQGLRRMYQREIQSGASSEDALASLTSFIESAGAAQTAFGLKGWDSSLVNGGMDTVMNQVLEFANYAEKSFDQAASDITGAVSSREFLYGHGMDENTINTLLTDIREQNIKDYSTLEKILVSSGKINRDMLMDQNADYGELSSQIFEAMYDTLANASDKDKTYLSEILSAYGFNMTSKEASGLLETQGKMSILTDTELKNAEEQNKQGREFGIYKSATEKHNKETENRMAEIAISAEQTYKGNEYVLAGFTAVEDGLNAITSITGDILSTLASEGFKSLIGSAAGSAAGSKAAGKVASGGLSTLINSEFVGGASGLAGAGIVGVVGAVAAAAAHEFIGKPWRESIENAVDPLQEATEEFMNSVNTQQSEAHETALAEEETLNTYKKILETNNTTAMKMYLSQKDNLEEELSKIEDDKELQELFKKNILADQENIVNQKKLDEQLANILQEDSTFLADVKTSYEGLAQAEYGKSWQDMSKQQQEQFIKEHEQDFAGKLSLEGIGDIGKQLESVESLQGSDLDAYLLQHGETSSAVSHMSTEDKINKAKEIKLKEIESKVGYTDETAAMLEHTMDSYYARKKIYEEASSSFQEQWDNAKAAWEKDNPNKTPTQNDIFNVYVPMYHADGLPSNSNIAIDEDGNYYLDPGVAYRNSYVFKTGLTNVPYDNYPAMLHKGERILTAAEADAYNEMSSYAVSNLVNQNRTYGNSSNVFNTNTYGISGVEDSINSQTTSLSRILNDILATLKTIRIANSSGTMSAAHKNVLMRNSNITQLNTL